MNYESHNHYLQKAAKYDLLSHFYKYSDPKLHDYYYHKHLQSITKAIPLIHVRQTKKFAHLRLFHVSSNIPAVDVYVNEMRILQNFAYKNASDYLSLPAGTYQIDIYPEGTTTSTIASQKLKLEANQYYTGAIAKRPKEVKLVTIKDSPAVPSGEAAFRFVHLASDIEAVDIAVKNGDIVFDQLTPEHASSYLPVYPIKVDLEIRPTGTKELIRSLPKTHFLVNQATSFYIVSTNTNNETTELAVISLTP
ncbi:DUF4397 domain-containing protein [Peribacillus asahii]|uniref:DUF4397 domain-containing protein n=1 Tax=Peribacillus asahii TaxID=228899 RepID=UPI003815DC4D